MMRKGSDWATGNYQSLVVNLLIESTYKILRLVVTFKPMQGLNGTRTCRNCFFIYGIDTARALHKHAVIVIRPQCQSSWQWDYYLQSSKRRDTTMIRLCYFLYIFGIGAPYAFLIVLCASSSLVFSLIVVCRSPILNAAKISFHAFRDFQES